MTTQRVLQGVLDNFLGTYVSRYSDHDGYLIFGKLVSEIQEISIDLLKAGGIEPKDCPLDVASRLAVSKFREQLEKAKLANSCVREAHLAIIRSPESRDAVVSGRTRNGYDVTFVVTAVSEHGKSYESRTTGFIAPHDPSSEGRSMRQVKG